ncbi:MAG TPA: phosphatase PAP2 family protein [Terriglobia bacterium]|nr:phosphatase PAP2 family protein [Terriglobia bacterium]
MMRTYRNIQRRQVALAGLWLLSGAVLAVRFATAQTPAEPAERQVSWKQVVPNILHDQKPIWLFPVHAVQGQHWKPALAVVLTTAGLVALDPHDTPYFHRTASFSSFNRALTGRNTTIGMTAVPGAFYLVALARHHHDDQSSALLAGEAAADSELLALVMKDVDRRVRPTDIPPGSDFSHTWFKSHGTLLNGENAAFPSGHVIGAFALATVFAERYGPRRNEQGTSRRRWVPWVAYGLASLVGFSRITQQSHFPSDVFAGAALGYFIAHGVVLQH